MTHLFLLSIKDLIAFVLVLGFFWFLEVIVIDVLGNLNTADVNLGAGCDDVDWVHSPQRYTVDFDGTCRGNKKKV